MDKLSLGRQSEEIAACFLRKKGMKILERNFSCNVGELDIIAKDKDAFVFIEVRSARGSFFHNPLDSLTKVKIRRLRILGQVWLKKHRVNDAYLRFDVIGIVYKQKEIDTITHIQDAF
jgi:putative endonuclease